MKFRTLEGAPIDDIAAYVHEAVSRNPMLTVSVGCDSSPHRPATYVVTVMLYDASSRHGAHVVFYRESVDMRSGDLLGRLQREHEMAMSVAGELDARLSALGERRDLTESERKRYKYHLLRCEGRFPVDPADEAAVIESIHLTDAERAARYRAVDIHLDYNAAEATRDTRGLKKNKSNLSYRSWVPYLRSMGYRVFVKPSAFAASSAADFLLH